MEAMDIDCLFEEHHNIYEDASEDPVWPREILQDAAAEEWDVLLEEPMCDAHAAYAAQSIDKCSVFDVLKTESTWLGKSSYFVSINSYNKFMMHIMQWPMVPIMQACDLPQLYLCAMTCRSLRTIALEIIETRAKTEMVQRYFGATQLCNFINVFAHFNDALSLTQWLPSNSLLHWTEYELDAIFDRVFDKHITCKTSNFDGLQTVPALNWQQQGRQAFGRFVRDCVAGQPSYRKILFHYNSSWALIKRILVSNADIIMDHEYGRGIAVVREYKVSWPTITVHFSSDMLKWQSKDVYEWFRLKKFPVSGLQDVQLDRAQLMRLFSIGELCSKGKNIFCTPRPEGLGMNQQQYYRFTQLMRARLLDTDKVCSSDGSFTFYVSC
jgi:hypothetical protein